MWRARVPPPQQSSSLFLALAATSSSSTGNTAARPRSSSDRPPLLMTLRSGMSATGEYSSSVLAVVSVAPASGPAMSLRMGDHRSHFFAGQRPRQFAAPQPVDDLDLLDVARVGPRVQELLVDAQLLRQIVAESAQRDL